MIAKEQQQAQLAALDTDGLIDEARRRAGLTDFGDESFKIPLRQLMDGCAREVNFHEVGLQDVRETTLRDLVNRLRIEEDIRLNPEILEEDVSDPITLLGLPRCGTTKTHRSIGSDPNLLKTYMWQLSNPARFPDAVPGEPDPRIAAAVGSDRLLEDNPAIRAAHLYGVQEIQSDMFLHGLTFNTEMYMQARMHSQSYIDWIRSRTTPSETDNWRYVRKVFQYLQWQQGGRQGRRWLFKHEAAVGELGAIREVYPKATLVHLHRDPHDCVASTLSLSRNIMSLRVADLDLAKNSRYVLDRTRLYLDRYLEARERLGLDDVILDVAYEDLRSKPIEIAERIYQLAGMPLTDEGRAAMLDWEANNAQGKHGEHRYTLQEFGLDEATIEQAFPSYIEKFAAYI